MSTRNLQIPFVIGHRGAAGLAPENTIAAVRKAHEVGTKWVEFDVMLAGSGEPITIHDPHIARTTSGKGKVGKLAYEAIRPHDAGVWFSQDYLGEYVPTLIEMIEQLKVYGMGANIEIKPYPGKDVDTALAVLEIINQIWPEELPPPLLSSFSLASLEAIRRVDQKIALGLLMKRWKAKWFTIAEALQCVSIHVKHTLLNERRAAAVKRAGKLLVCYTVNSPEKALQYAKWGVDAVITDYPDQILLSMAEANQ